MMKEALKKVKSAGVFLLLSLIVTSCAAGKNYVLMEKQMADGNGRHRSIVKIAVQGAEKGKPQGVEAALKQAVSELVKDDPDLDCVLVWAYRNRKELNQSYTLGKLEYSKDKNGWDGNKKTEEQIVMEVAK